VDGAPINFDALELFFSWFLVFLGLADFLFAFSTYDFLVIMGMVLDLFFGE